MADTTSTSPAATPATATKYDLAVTYDVQLKRVIEWPAGSGFHFYPRDKHHMSGALCAEIADDISAASPVKV